MIRAQPSWNKTGQEAQPGKSPEHQPRSGLPDIAGTFYTPDPKQDCASNSDEALEVHWLSRFCSKHALALGFIYLLSCAAKLLQNDTSVVKAYQQNTTHLAPPHP